MTTLCEILNDPQDLKEIDRLLAPSNINTEKGSFLVAKAITRWSNNSFSPIMWSSRVEPEYWGLEASLIVKDDIRWKENNYSEFSIFINPQSAGVEGKLMLNKVKNIGWPNYNTKLAGLSRQSNAGKHPKWTQALTEKQNIVIQNILDFINNKVQYSNKLDTILALKSDISKTYLLGKTLSIEGVPYQYTNLVWPTYRHSQIVADRWPTNLTNKELLIYLNQSINAPSNIKCLVTNIKWYKRLNKNMEWGVDEWNSLESIIKSIFTHKDKITQESVKTIKNMPDTFKHMYVKHLYENEDSLNVGPYMVEYLMNSKVDLNYDINSEISIVNVLSNENNQYSEIARIIRICHEILSEKLKPTTFFPNSLEQILGSMETLKHDGKLCILKAMYQMDWHIHPATIGYFPSDKYKNMEKMNKLIKGFPWLEDDKTTDYYLFSIDKMSIQYKAHCERSLYGILQVLRDDMLDEDYVYNNIQELKKSFNKLSTISKYEFFKLHQHVIVDTISKTQTSYEYLKGTGKYITYPNVVNELYTIFDPELPIEQTNTLRLFYETQGDRFREGWRIKLASNILQKIESHADVIDYDLI